MPTLLLRLAGPLQSWGIDSKFETRRTLPFPTKSGVIGLVAAALGYSRDDDESLKRLNSLRFGVRIDREGELLRDFHTAKGKKDEVSYITERYYLADAVFLAGLESDDFEFLCEIEEALHYPEFPLYLGRRSCVPTMPLVLGIRNKPLLIALQDEPLQLSELTRKKLRASSDKRKLRIIADIAENEKEKINPAAVLKDLPVSFSKIHRKFTWRPVREEYIEKSEGAEEAEKLEEIEEIEEISKTETPTTHDALSELE